MTLQELNEKIGGRYPITERQFRFVLAYAEHGNGMKAIRDAGYNHATPGAQSSASYRLRRLDRIQRALALVKNGG